MNLVKNIVAVDVHWNCVRVYVSSSKIRNFSMTPIKGG